MAISRAAPDRRLAHADARAASVGLAGRPVAGHDRADDACASSCRRPSPSSRPRSAASFADQAEIAMVVLDNRTGGVVAWLGGSDFFGRAGQVDLVRAHRSPGSALKPLIYAMAFDDRTLHPESLVEDVPVRFRDWLPRNFDRDHQGAVTVRRALQQSLNVPAVLALEKVGPQRFLSTLRTAGVSPGLPPGDTGNSLGIALGSATISPLEMAGLYAGLANGGSFAPPHRPPRPAGARAGAPDRPDRRLVCRRRAGRRAAARGLRLPARGAARAPHRLQDRHLGRLPRCLGRGLQHQLDGRRLGRPCRRHAAPRPARPPRGAADRCSRRSAACPPRTTAPPRRRPTCCASPPIASCRCACAPWRRRVESHGGPRIAYPPADARIELARARGRAAQRHGRRGPPALAGRRPPARRHQMGARRARRRRASPWSTRPAIPAPSPCASSSGADAGSTAEPLVRPAKVLDSWTWPTHGRDRSLSRNDVRPSSCAHVRCAGSS